MKKVDDMFQTLPGYTKNNLTNDSSFASPPTKIRASSETPVSHLSSIDDTKEAGEQVEHSNVTLQL